MTDKEHKSIISNIKKKILEDEDFFNILKDTPSDTKDHLLYLLSNLVIHLNRLEFDESKNNFNVQEVKNLLLGKAIYDMEKNYENFCKLFKGENNE